MLHSAPNTINPVCVILRRHFNELYTEDLPRHLTRITSHRFAQHHYIIQAISFT